MSSDNLKKSGEQIIKDYLTELPNTSGVYQMFNSKNQCLYVGKAKNLKKRVINYTTPNKNSLRIQKMIYETAYMQHILTNNEENALLLEADLIKNLNPKYNILLRDDKTSPFIELDLTHPFPRIRRIKTKDITRPNLFGPFANSAVVEETISLIQKTFKIRVCSDHNFNNRSRPCIYYQIKRCSAPCVNKISATEYNDAVQNTTALLKGDTINLKAKLADLMEEASVQDNFEKAIIYRDQIKTLSQLSLNYSVILPSNINADIVAIVEQNNVYCIQIFIFRNGRSNGCIAYFPTNTEDLEVGVILNYFLIQFYKNHPLPPVIYCNILPCEPTVLSNALKSLTGTNAKISSTNHTIKEAMDLVITNANSSLEKQLSTATIWQTSFEEISQLFGFTKTVQRIEIYDNSHFKGSAMLGVMVCAEVGGFNKKEYRIFNLKNNQINKEDDYGMLREALTRRLSKLDKNDISNYPDLLLIDGGIKQLNVAISVLKELDLENKIQTASIVKGENRKFGAEKIILSNLQILNLADHQNTFKFILKLRDEAHRFAITSQRKANLKKSTSSILDNISGIGNKRKQLLLNHFGSVENIKNASLKELMNVSNINSETAKKILEWLN
ncbi:excinuclease ABC subunit UvrC [Rickettsiales bacterium LUAb2]